MLSSSSICLSDPLNPKRSTNPSSSAAIKKKLVREAIAAAQALNVLKKRLNADFNAQGDDKCTPATIHTRQIIYSYKFAKFI